MQAAELPAIDARFDRRRFLQRLVVAGCLGLIGIQVVLLVVGWVSNRDVIPLGLDWLGYRAGVERLLATGSPYAPFELVGPFAPEHLDFIHPPSALLLFAPFAALPHPLDFVAWVGIPMAVLVILSRRLVWWAWPIVALASMTDTVQFPILNGNSSLWICAAFGLGLRYGWPAGLVALKPSLLPLALPAIKRPIPALILALVPILVTLPLLPQYLTVLRNASLPLSYSVGQHLLVLLYLLPWLTEHLPGWWAHVAPVIARRSATPGHSRG